MAETTTIDTHTLEFIPEEHRANATSYEAPDALWTQKDADTGKLKSGAKVGDVREAAHTRYTVTFTEKDPELVALEKRIADLEAK
tara:strand:+ start:488 stop:742 length:255 start_codon:yes stop_codon:yes gene_type:complete